MILRVNCLYCEIVINRPYFVPHTIPYNMLKFLTISLVTPSHTTRDAFVNLSFAFFAKRDHGTHLNFFKRKYFCKNGCYGGSLISFDS